MSKAVMRVPLAYIDAVILKLLPKEGTRVGLKEIGKSSRLLENDLKDDGATANMIGGRLNSLKHKKYVRQVIILPTSQGIGYQITPKGEEALREYERQYGEERKT